MRGRGFTFGSVCSGIEAASVAWLPLGWRCAFVSEIEAFPRAVLKHHYPDTPLHGDFTTIEAGEYEPIDLLVGGTPCQDFSVAGLRAGMAGDRGNLTLQFLTLARRLRPRWLVWENVPGVLSSNEGRDFGAFLGGELGYGWAYRTLDAQFFGVAQRRRRVFVVGYLGDWRRAAAVLFERHCLSGHPAPSREAGEGTSGTIAGGARQRGGYSADDIPLTKAYRGNNQSGPLEIATAVNAHGGPHGRLDFESETFIAHALRAKHNLAHRHDADTLVAHALRAEGFDASEDGTGRGTPLVPVAFNITPSNSNKDYNARASDRAQAITSGGNRPSARGGDLIAFDLAQITSAANRTRVDSELPASTLNAKGQMHVAGTAETMYGVSHADAAQTGPREALRALLEAAGEEAFTQWGLGVLAPFWPTEVLRPEVHGRGVRCSALPQRGLVNVALSRSQTGAAWSVQDLWEAGCDGRAPSGWRPHEQHARQLGAYLSELPYSPSPAQRFLLDLWIASERAGLLREALSALQEARRSTCGEGQSTQSGSAVRRLTVEECEALQGFPRSYTAVPYRGKPAADGPRYKALGNSMAVPVMAWIGRRIALVEALQSHTQAA